jgi:flagellar biosynthesis chaperone FliJ
MTDISEKIAWVSKNLYRVQDITAKDKFVGIDKRKPLVAVMQDVVKDLTSGVKVLPNNIKQGDVDLTAELRRIRTTSNSILEALNDKVCKPSQAIRLIKDVHASVIKVRKSLTDNLANRIAQEGHQGDAADLLLEAQKTVLAAKGPSVILTDFSELENFAEFKARFNKDLQTLNDANADVNAQEPEDAPAVIDPEEADSYSRSLERLVENHHFAENKYGERADKNALDTQKGLAEVFSQAKKSVKIDPKIGYSFVKMPLICVTQHFIADSALKKSGIKYIRLPNGLNAGFAPGLTPERGGDTSSYVIFENQLLLAFPISTLRDPQVYSTLRDNTLRALQHNMGRLLIVRFGNVSRYVAPKEPKKGEKEDAVKIDPYNGRIDQRQYFSNKAYPGIGFVWIMPQDRLNAISNVKYVSVDIATAPNLKSSLDTPVQNNRVYHTMDEKKAALDSQAKKDLAAQDAIVNETAANKARRIAEAKEGKQKAVGGLEAKMQAAEKAEKAVESQVKEAKNGITAAQQTVQENVRQLAHMKPGTPAYRGANAAKTAAEMAITHYQEQLNSLKTKLPALIAARKDLQSAMQTAMEKFIAKRKKIK